MDNTEDDYRTRCYDSYVSKHWGFSHDFSEKMYEHFAKVSRKRFKAILPSRKDAKIIDVACGYGYFLYYYLCRRIRREVVY